MVYKQLLFQSLFLLRDFILSYTILDTGHGTETGRHRETEKAKTDNNRGKYTAVLKTAAKFVVILK